MAAQQRNKEYESQNHQGKIKMDWVILANQVRTRKPNTQSKAQIFFILQRECKIVSKYRILSKQRQDS